MIDFKQRLQELRTMKKEDFKVFCSKCGSISQDETIIKERQEKFIIKGEEFLVKGNGRFCKKCDCRISDVVLDDKMLIEAHNEYKKMKGLLSSKEIEEIRNCYGLSSKKFAMLLNLGDHTIYRYERGCIQENSHNTLIKSIRNYSDMYEYLKKNQTRLKESDVEKIMKMCEIKMNTFMELSQNVIKVVFSPRYKFGVC